MAAFLILLLPKLHKLKQMYISTKVMKTRSLRRSFHHGWARPRDKQGTLGEQAELVITSNVMLADVVDFSQFEYLSKYVV